MLRLCTDNVRFSADKTENVMLINKYKIMKIYNICFRKMEFHAVEGSIMESSFDVSYEVEVETSIIVPPTATSTPKIDNAGCVKKPKQKPKKVHKCKGAGCTYTTTVKSNLERHSKIHNNIFYNCDTCSAKFREKYELRMHIQRFHEGAKLICDTCGKSYKSRQGFMAHKSIGHSTESSKKTCLCSM
jgi:DNA-directed RNA polymerase subunit M/transcription elongation factor TFIIS